jgi:hypothetical protein
MKKTAGLQSGQTNPNEVQMSAYWIQANSVTFRFSQLINSIILRFCAEWWILIEFSATYERQNQGNVKGHARALFLSNIYTFFPGLKETQLRVAGWIRYWNHPASGRRVPLLELRCLVDLHYITTLDILENVGKRIPSKQLETFNLINLCDLSCNLCCHNNNHLHWSQRAGIA